MSQGVDAAATRELLEAEARRKRKAAALREWNRASSSNQKKGPAAAPVSPETVVEGTVLPNGAFWNKEIGGSPIAHPWMRPQALDPSTWDHDPTPPGGFTNFIKNHPQMSQMGPSHFVPFKPPQPMDTSPSQGQTTTSLDSGDELVRTDKRILWTQEEDVRLMSSWLLNSTDSSQGADRKNEQYWLDVVDTYNQTTPGNRKINFKQAKDRWHKINRWTDLFHNAWLKARRVFTSGYNDQMWIDKAHHFYMEDNELGPFVLMDVWYAVKNEAKWVAYNDGLKAARKRKVSDKEVAYKDSDVVDVEENVECPRPIGQKQAKKAARENKNKSKLCDSDIEELHTLGRIQSEDHANRVKVLEAQQKLSSDKLEAAKLAHLTAKEQKEAAKDQKEAAKDQKEAKRYEAEARMFETYNRLLSQDVGLMSNEEKVDHVATMKALKKKLFAEFN